MRTAAGRVGVPAVEMGDGWTQVVGPAVEGRGGRTLAGSTKLEMGDGWTHVGFLRGGKGDGGPR